MKGYYVQEEKRKESEIPKGRLNIEVKNLPEFRKLVIQAEREADRLKKTIDRLQNFELHIDFSSEPTSSES